MTKDPDYIKRHGGPYKSPMERWISSLQVVIALLAVASILNMILAIFAVFNLFGGAT